MLTDKDCKKMAEYFCMALKQDAELQDVMARAMTRVQGKSTVLISAKRAAEMIGVSIWQLYRIKDDETGKPQFSYTKTGTGKSATLRFNASTIVEEYQRYIARNT